MVEVIRMDGNSLSMHTTFLMVLSPPVNHCNVAWWQHFISVYHVKQKVVVHLLWGGGRGGMLTNFATHKISYNLL